MITGKVGLEMKNNQTLRKPFIPLLISIISIAMCFLALSLAGKALVALSFGVFFIAFALATGGVIQGIKRLRMAGGKILVSVGIVLCIISMILLIYFGFLVYVFETH